MSRSMTERRGTWKESTGERVSGAEARQVWAEAARPALVTCATAYGTSITYKELAERVQATTGVHTTQRMDYWIGNVLGRVAKQCRERGEPLLSAFCLHADDTVGIGYAKAVEENLGVVPDDPDVHAAEERLAAHLFFGAELPPGGGLPLLPKKVTLRRNRARASTPRTRAKCPVCNLDLPLSGVCDSCQ